MDQWQEHLCQSPLRFLLGWPALRSSTWCLREQSFCPANWHLVCLHGSSRLSSASCEWWARQVAYPSGELTFKRHWTTWWRWALKEETELIWHFINFTSNDNLIITIFRFQSYIFFIFAYSIQRINYGKVVKKCYCKKCQTSSIFFFFFTKCFLQISGNGEDQTNANLEINKQAQEIEVEPLWNELTTVSKTSLSRCIFYMLIITIFCFKKRNS